VPDAQAKLPPILRRWSEAEPDSLAVRQKIVEVSLANKDYPTAAAAATEIIHRNVEDAAAHAALAEAFAALDKVAAALEEYQTALRLDATQANWQAGLAKLLLRSGKKDEAAAAIERLRELDSKHPQLTELEKALAP
jgi:Flp pilus assembly protein TadD